VCLEDLTYLLVQPVHHAIHLRVLALQLFVPLAVGFKLRESIATAHLSSRI
jgi:hypothetical protein